MNQDIEAPSSIYFCIGRMLMIAPLQENELHHHGAIQIVLAMEQPFSIRIENGDWQETTAVIIDSNVPHHLKDLHGHHISLSIVPERSHGQHLQQYVLKGLKVQYLDYLDVSLYRNKFQQCLDQQHNCPRAFQLCEEFIDHLTGVRGYPGIIDDRIQRVINWIQQNLSKPISARKLAQSVYLSEDRFLHLFKEQLGLPLRQYILYQRVMTAILEYLRGKNLTHAAYLAGFSDSAHFTRTFVAMNGFKPSQLAKHKEMVQFCFCSSFCDACNQLRNTVTK
jgi:AraC-like DNA-binding protein